MVEQKTWLEWDHNEIVWDDNQYTWDQVFILSLIEGFGGGASGFPLNGRDPWGDLEKKAKKAGLKDKDCEYLLKLIVDFNGLKTSQERTVDCVKKKITVKHIVLTLQSVVPSIRIKAENIGAFA